MIDNESIQLSLALCDREELRVHVCGAEREDTEKTSGV